MPHSSVEAGERPFRTPGSEGGAALWTGSWNHAEDTVPHQRVTAKRPGRVRDSDIHNVTNRMPLTCTSGSVGGLGGRPTRSTRPKDKDVPWGSGPPGDSAGNRRTKETKLSPILTVFLAAGNLSSQRPGPFV